MLLSTIALTTLPMPIHATEEPEYRIVRELADIEVRQYAAYAVAEVVVPGPASEAGNQAFPILAGYIFGKNKGNRKFAMTAPVTQISEPTRIEMTVPATQPSVMGTVRVQFVLPKEVTMATAPEPIDPRIQLRLVTAGNWAVLRYSGSWSQANYQEHLSELKTLLEAQGVTTQGEPVLARYNAPFTPWFMRRNEIWLALQ